MVITSGLTNAASASTASNIQLGSCVDEIGSRAFSGCNNITGIDFPDALTTIGSYAFYECNNLSAVTIHSGITSIGYYAFALCDSLERITFESNTPIVLGDVRPFGEDIGYPLYVPFESYTSYVSAWPYYKNRITYEGMPYMAKIYSEGDDVISFIPCSPSSTTITDAKPIVSAFTNPIVEFGECVTEIGNEAFKSNYYTYKKYNRITFTSGITSIGTSAFTAIDVDNINLHFDNLTYLGDFAFGYAQLPSGSTLYIGDKINYIGNYAFYVGNNHSGITDIHIVGNSATTYGRNMFDVVIPLNSLVIDNTNELPSGRTFSTANTVTLSNVRQLRKSCLGLVETKLTINGNGAIIGDDYGSIFSSQGGYEYELELGEGISEIATSAFCNSKISGRLVIPNSVTTIGAYAFADTSTYGLYQHYTGLTVGSGVTSIGTNAFKPGSYNRINELTLVDGLRHFNYSFGGYPISRVTLSNTLEEIVDKFLSGTIITNVAIPNTVTSIGASAFTNCIFLTRVSSDTEGVFNIPNGVTSIGAYAFYGCNSATSLSLNSSLRTIGECAFRGLTRLTTLTIPSNVVTIGASAFAGCYHLGSIIVNRTTPPVLGNGALDDTSNCTIYVPQGSYDLYVNAEGWSAYRDRIWAADQDYKALLIYDGYNSAIPCSSGNTTLSQIPSNNASTIIVGNCVTSIDGYAFTNCSGVTNVSIGSGVTSIGEWAFEYRPLTSITIPDNVTTIGNGAFAWCNSLRDAYIGSGLTTLSGYAFQYCGNLENVDIQSGSIGEAAFKYCSGLTTCTLGGGVTSIGTEAFSGCTSLSSITIPDSVTSIGDYAFGYCGGLTSANIQGGSIDQGAFGWCSGLTTCTLGSGVTSIGINAFNSCSGLTSITIPDNVSTIGANAFRYCSGLATSTLGSGVTSIGNGAFEGCNSLTSVTIPSGVTNIGQFAFEDCSGLTSADIQGGSMEWGAFESCKSLSSVVIGNNVTNIGTQVFEYCTSLATVIVNATTPPTIAYDTFRNTPIASGTGNIYVPTALVDTYKTADGWKDFADIIQAIPNS